MMVVVAAAVAVVVKTSSPGIEHIICNNSETIIQQIHR